MNNVEAYKLVYLTLIAGRGQKDDLVSALAEAGARLISTIYGKGTVKASYIKNVLGLVPEKNKVMISCVLAYHDSQAIMQMLVDRFNFDKPNTGIAFTIPIDKLSF